MSLMVLLVLASCSYRTPQLFPTEGDLPEQAVVYLRGDDLQLFDVHGGSPTLTELARRRDITVVRITAQAGSEFRLSARFGTAEVTRFGPYRVVSAGPQPVPAPPEFRFANRSHFLETVFLGFEPQFPAYRVEIETLDGPKEGEIETILLLKNETYLGYETCLANTYDWSSDAVKFRVAGLSADGSVTEPTDWRRIRRPLRADASDAMRVLDWFIDRWLILLGLSGSTAVLISVWRRRQQLKS